MKITRDGKTYDLTASEIELAYNEKLHENWRNQIAEAVYRNEASLSFGLDYTTDEFIQECVRRIDSGIYDDEDDDKEKYDEIVFDTAKVYGVWTEWEEDAE